MASMPPIVEERDAEDMLIPGVEDVVRESVEHHHRAAPTPSATRR